MAKYEAWLVTQQKDVESDGTKSQTIVLELDDKALATWATDNPDIKQEIETMLDLQADDLPKGQNICKFVSYDQKGNQLSSLTHAIHGRNVEAKKSGSADKAHAMATSVHLDNANTVQRPLAAENARLVDQNNELLDQKLDLTKSLIGLSTATIDFQRKIDREEKRSEMYAELIKTASPMIQMVIALGAEYASDKLSEMIKTNQNDKTDRETLRKRIEELETKLAQQTEVSHGQDSEPTHNASTDSAGGTPQAQADGSKRHAGNGGNGTRSRGNRTSGKSTRKSRAGRQTAQTKV
jgi:hypothetical protein